MSEAQPGSIAWHRLEAEKLDNSRRFQRANDIDVIVKQLVTDYRDLMSEPEGEWRAARYRFAVDCLIPARDKLRGFGP